MPTIACPGCGKKYNVPATAAGQVAKCACGKRFRLSASKAPAAATPAAVTSAVSTATRATRATSRKPNSTSASPAPKSRPAAPVAKKATDDFWDDALREEQTAKVVPTAPRPAPSVAAAAITSAPTKPTDAPKKKKKKSSGGIRWGADWGKVGGGLLTFLIAGGITLGLVVSTGRLFFWPAGIAIVGLFTALSGLMGEEGIW